MGNVKDFVRDGHAWFKCLECGAETTILKWDFDHQRGFEVINNDRTVDNIVSFSTKHRLCKSETVQTDLFKEVTNG
jgi:hypothetical protein